MYYKYIIQALQQIAEGADVGQTISSLLGLLPSTVDKIALEEAFMQIIDNADYA